MRVLVTGANGFIGTRVVAALREAGHEVVAAVRRPSASDLAQQSAIATDFARDTDLQIWTARLHDIDAVVNCAGILRETRSDTFQSVHVDAPLALFRACVVAGVRTVIQLSALGEPSDGEFIASKHRGDQALSGLDLDWLVLRPGLAYSAHGAYGGTVLLRAMATLPGMLLVPGDGSQQLRPIAAEDLACVVVAALASPQWRGKVIEVVGPEILTLRNYLLAWRAWFGLPTPRVVATPKPLVNVTVALAELCGRGPLCRAIANLLERRRIGDAQAPERTHELLGRSPMSLAEAMSRRPCQPQDFFLARWYTLRYLLLFILALVWVASGLVGLALPESSVQATIPAWSPAILRATTLASSVADLMLGLALLTGRWTRPVLALMLTMVAIYTLAIGSLAPEHWLDPLGGLLKNLPIAAILIVLLAMDPHRR